MGKGLGVRARCINIGRGLGLLSVSFLGACASTGDLPAPPHLGAAKPTAQVERFAYDEGSDRNVRVSVDQVLVKGDHGFIPGDASWVQLHLVVANVGSSSIWFSGLKEKLGDGTVVAAATTGSEIVKPASMTKTLVTDLGVSTVGMMAGLFIPFAGPIAGAAVMGKMGMDFDRQMKANNAMTHGLHPDSIAPGTSMAGEVFVPAAATQTGLLVFYYANGLTGTSRSVFLSRHPS
jgi:hypothetical protein